MKRIFFLISSKHEFFEFLFIRKYFDNSFHVFLLIEDNIRTSDIYLKNLDSKIEPIYLPNIFYSKKIFSNILKYKTLIKKLKLLNVKSNDKFIFFYGGSLLYFLVLKYFKNKGTKTVMFLTSWFYIKKKSGSIKLFENIWINMLSYFILFKRIKVIYYKNTIYWNHRINYKIDYVICLRNDVDETLKFNRCYYISNFFKNSKIQNFTEEKHLLILSSYWESIFSDYNKIIILLINEIGLENLLIKDHPTSPLNESQIKSKYGINDYNIISKNISLENYLIDNKRKIKTVLGPTSAALKYSSFLEINSFCYSNLFMSQKHYKDYSNEYFQLNNIKMLKSISEFKKSENLKFKIIKKREKSLISVFNEIL